MNRIILTLLLGISFLNASHMVMRSEFEKVGDTIGTFDESFTIVSGNEDTEFVESNGSLIIDSEIDDLMNVVHRDSLIVQFSNRIDTLIVVDGYDYLLTNHTGTVLSDHNAISSRGDWTAYNNLWGKGSGVPNQDFRIAILNGDSLPNGSTIIWDVPGKAQELYNGASVWCYTNMMFGNRYGVREDLPQFPFCLDSLSQLSLQFDYEPVIGNDQFKVALNCFLTDEDSLVPFSENDGDFFMVFDQIGTWIPPYPDTVVVDTLIGDHPYMLLYKEEAGYEWRRVIVKDHHRFQKGNVDLLGLFKRFAGENMVDMQQSIPNIQFGVEVTDGFGALAFNQLQIDMSFSGETAVDKSVQTTGKSVRVSPQKSGVRVAVDHSSDLSLFSLSGALLEFRDDFLAGVVGTELPQGVYILTVDGVVEKVLLP